RSGVRSHRSKQVASPLRNEAGRSKRPGPDQGPGHRRGARDAGRRVGSDGRPREGGRGRSEGDREGGRRAGPPGGARSRPRGARRGRSAPAEGWRIVSALASLGDAYEAAAAEQGTAALARVHERGDAGYLPGSGMDAQAVLALCRMGLVRRETECPPDAPALAGVKATRWRYYVTGAGRRLLTGEAASAAP